MKTLYLIRHAKAGWDEPKSSDFERTVSKQGKKDINTMGSYLALKSISPELVLSSCALRAQETTDMLLEKLDFHGEKFYLQELYMASVENIREIISVQDDKVNTMFIIGHNPQLQELINSFIDEHISKFPSMGIIAIHFNIESWEEIEKVQGEIDFYIFPKQFKYYMPKQIRASLL